MTVLCMLTWCVGAWIAMFAGTSGLKFRGRSAFDTRMILSAHRWHTARVILSRVVGAALIVLSMALAARNAGLL